MLRAITAHLGSRQVSRVIYGAIIGLALIVALEEHPPSSGVVVATLLGTALAVGLAEFYSDIIGTETRTRRHVRRAELRDMMYDVLAVAYGIALPAVFFVLAAADAIEEERVSVDVAGARRWAYRSLSHPAQVPCALTYAVRSVPPTSLSTSDLVGSLRVSHSDSSAASATAPSDNRSASSWASL